MRMHTRGTEQVQTGLVQLAAELESSFAFFEAGAGKHHLHDAGRSGALDDRRCAGGECRVAQIDADVDKLHGYLELKN